MATIGFQFMSTDPDLILKTLEFEGDGSGIDSNSGSVTRNIVGLLDININVEGAKSKAGESWSLIVTVNGKPIITHDGTGSIRGYIGSDGKSNSYGAYSWYF